MAKFKFKGFTLIEVLIVIVVIGILAAGFMYSSTEAVTTAKATEILANLNTVKNAMLAFYSDNPDLFEYGSMKFGIQNYLYADADGRTNLQTNLQKERVALITKYFDKKNIIFQKYGGDINIKTADGNSTTKNHIPFADEGGTYGVADAGEKDSSGNMAGVNSRYTWFVGYKFKKGEEAVKKKMENMKNSAGLLFAGDIPNFTPDTGRVDDENVNKLGVVWLRVFGDWEKTAESGE